MTLKDYSVIKACGHTILCVGGATSIDRALRMASRQYHIPNPDDPFMSNVYWPNEIPEFDKARLSATSSRIIPLW